MTLTHDAPVALIPLDAWAGQQGISKRTAMRWLADGEVPDAVQDDPTNPRSPWKVPADAVRQPVNHATKQARRAGLDIPPGADVATLPTMPGPPQTADDILTRHRGLVPLDDIKNRYGIVTLPGAVSILGASKARMLADRDYYQIRADGEHGAFVMPRGRLKEILG